MMPVRRKRSTLGQTQRLVRVLTAQRSACSNHELVRRSLSALSFREEACNRHCTPVHCAGWGPLGGGGYPGTPCCSRTVFLTMGARHGQLQDCATLLTVIGVALSRLHVGRIVMSTCRSDDLLSHARPRLLWLLASRSPSDSGRGGGSFVLMRAHKSVHPTRSLPPSSPPQTTAKSRE